MFYVCFIVLSFFLHHFPVSKNDVAGLPRINKEELSWEGRKQQQLFLTLTLDLMEDKVCLLFTYFLFGFLSQSECLLDFAEPIRYLYTLTQISIPQKI